MQSLAARIILLWGWQRSLVAFLAGALAVLSQAPYDFFPVCFVSFPVLVWLLDGATGERGDGWVRRLSTVFGIGWWFGFGYFVFGLWWIGKALLVDAEAFAWALPLAILGLPAGLAVFYGFACVVARLCWPDGLGRIAALAFGFGLAEWLRATVLTGFPWNAIGYAAMPIPLLMQSVYVVGLFGISALSVFVFAAPAVLASDRQRRITLALATLVATAHVAYGAWSLAVPVDVARKLSIRIVQPSIPQGGKWDPEMRDEILARLLELSARPTTNGRTPELIVWPETALPFLLTDRPDALAAIGGMLVEGQLLVLGAVRSEPGTAAGEPTRYYNATVAIDHRGEIVDAVDKVHLVPFGEYLPLEGLFQRFGLRTVAETVGGFSPGVERRPISVAPSISAEPMICYEVIFPGEVAIAEADFILNLTNDAWFGNTPGPYQHFRQAQVRAVESGRLLVRSANNGISGIVDRSGRVVDAYALDVIGVLDSELLIPVEKSHVSEARKFGGVSTILLLAIIACGMNVLVRLRSD
ncbi:apolipoprotein N-acyltransferase [Aquibium carbonis]|uniref:Apolipoprotein N-acyltransferase n=1 Tax=Aquibium carbonis TaxID=2495581 RepID=A0A429Z1Q1_9HYPH|nr:apolipoprotein N-acyltransferase [Aquibium carbonis]RST87560.1 apolipoprotein N-acyltransferase [Aquibium carbonis]